MTKTLPGLDVASHINDAFPDTVVKWSDTEVWIEPQAVHQVLKFLKDSPDLEFASLTAISAVDYIEYFEVVYHLLSMKRNHSAIVKTRCHGRSASEVPSVVDIWRGADLQEREIWDLMGIRFTGHPNMKRVLLWEGFEGHPLRKDFLR